MARPRVAPASTPVALLMLLRLRALLTVSRRNLQLAAQPATRMPNGLTSVMPSTTQPWLHSARKNARMPTGWGLAGKKCRQSRSQRGKQCQLTSRTLPQAHATPFEQLEAKPKRQNSPTKIKDWQGHHWSEHPAAALGGALSGALLNPEHRHRHCPQCPAWVASNRGAWQHANTDEWYMKWNTGRAQHSHQWSHLWGKDGIPPEVLKHGKQTILQPLHDCAGSKVTSPKIWEMPT